jgi:hypothetical protein
MRPAHCLCLAAVLLAGPLAAEEAKLKPPLGMNLSGVVDWSSEIVFVDAFRAARPWISQEKGKAWGKGPALDLDAKGNLRSLKENQYAETVVWTGFDKRFPSGTFTCFYDGDGDVDFTGDAKVIQRKKGEMKVEVEARHGSCFCRITRTNGKDPVRRIRLILPGHEKTYEKEPFHPDFLKRWKGFRVFRFMDWQRTNGSTLVEWSARATPEHHSQAQAGGVAAEIMIDLCNRLKVDPWFCMPHLASDDFVRQFAARVNKKLDRGRKIYVEYSNECWNGGFAQARYCAERGKKLGLSKNAYEAQLRYYSQRSVEIFRLWEKEFGGRERLVRVLATQSANQWTGGAVLDWKDAHEQADAVAIAPYFGYRFGNPKTADKVAAMSADDLVAELAKDVEASKKVLAGYAELARKRKLTLMAYEGGQHLAGYQGAENNDKLTKLFQEANRHPKMKDLYLADLKNWREAGGGLFCVFSSMGNYSKWGSWGVLEHTGQDADKAPKYQALREYLAGK